MKAGLAAQFGYAVWLLPLWYILAVLSFAILIRCIILKVRNLSLPLALVSLAVSLGMTNDFSISFINRAGLPLVKIAAVMMMAAVMAALWKSYRELSSWQKEHLSPMSIKESFDTLPTGLSYGSDDGVIILTNYRMNELSSELFGKSFQNIDLFWSSLQTGPYKEGVEVISTRPEVLLKNGDQVWSFRHAVLESEIGMITQITAADVTEAYDLNEQLNRDSAEVQRLNRELKKFSSDMTQITREEEILRARMEIHDDIGKCLLAGKRALKEGSTQKEREELLEMWRQNVILLQQDDDPTDNLQELFEAARQIGVRIVISGPMPASLSKEELLLEGVMHECLTNTVRHAAGDQLNVEITDEGVFYNVVCTNNGIQPGADAHEGTGLSSLRARIERAGGQMEIEWQPRFRLTAKLVKGGTSL